MRSFLFILVCLTSVLVQAQNSATNFFNAGAQLYTYGKTQSAKEVVNNGLQAFPNDRKLNALKKKIEEEEEKKNKDQKDQQNKDQKDNKDKQNDKNKDQKGDDKDKKDDKQDQKNDDQNNQQKPNQDQKDKQNQQPKPQQGKMTPEQMKQLLESLNNEENKTQKKINAQKSKGRKVKQEKDW
ncbi:hypothetical protein [Tenacibaculum sp. 47A_GOM-205m]|uniref:hypothetical protein n=1 Tax=Tenacibaculum sp. 47A_GOM-205m TaxID=1380384 RepID=UPI0004B1F446|nr:hypothetical protein [Tenacibaculum sp. 47A_GOM-205m]